MIVHKFEQQGTDCVWVWTLRFHSFGNRFQVTCNGAGSLWSKSASRTKAKRLLGRFLNWACFNDASLNARMAHERR